MHPWRTRAPIHDRIDKQAAAIGLLVNDPDKLSLVRPRSLVRRTKAMVAVALMPTVNLAVFVTYVIATDAEAPGDAVSRSLGGAAIFTTLGVFIYGLVRETRPATIDGLVDLTLAQAAESPSEPSQPKPDPEDLRLTVGGRYEIYLCVRDVGTAQSGTTLPPPFALQWGGPEHPRLAQLPGTGPLFYLGSVDTADGTRPFGGRSAQDEDIFDLIVGDVRELAGISIDADVLRRSFFYGAMMGRMPVFVPIRHRGKDIGAVAIGENPNYSGG